MRRFAPQLFCALRASLRTLRFDFFFVFFRVFVVFLFQGQGTPSPACPGPKHRAGALGPREEFRLVNKKFSIINRLSDSPAFS